MVRRVEAPIKKIRGSDDNENDNAVQTAKRQLIKKKLQKITDSTDQDVNKDEAEAGLDLFSGVIGGSDDNNSPPPEQPPVPSTKTGDLPAPKTGATTITAENVPPGMTLFKDSELETFIVKKAQESLQPTVQKYIDQIEALTKDADQQRRLHNEQLQSLNQNLDAVAAERDRLEKVFTHTGSSTPLTSTDRSSTGAVGGSYAVNFLRFPTSKELQGAAKDFAEFLENPAYCRSARTVDDFGSILSASDSKAISKFIRNNRKALAEDMETYAKGNGFLLGIGKDAVQTGNTRGGVGGSIPQAFLDYLSAEMRMAKHPKYIWWQFANFALGLGTPVGSTILVPKFENLDEPDSEANFTLDTLDNFTNIGPNSQALIMNTVPVQIKGYGLGLGNNPNNTPVAIPEFIEVTSLVELMSVLNRKLTRNYNGFVDMMIRGYYRQARFNAANVYYNNSGAAVTDPTQVVAGSDGTMTLAFLDNMFAAATDLDIPSLDDGRRIAVLSNKSASQLKSDLSTQWEAPSPEALQALTNILNASYPGGDVDNVSGYIGEYSGFHCFQNFSSSKGAAGSEGVYTGDAMQTGAGATAAIATATPADAVMRDNYFFGPDAVAKGTAIPMGIRMDPTTNFDRLYRFIWYEICGFGPIAVSSVGSDGTTPTNQEDHVLIGRTSDTVL